jgi:hypothetical protein
MKGSAPVQIMRVGKMEYDLEPVSLDALFSLHEVAASGRVDTAALIAKFRTQRQRTQQLEEYCDQIVTEIRASLGVSR